MRSSSMNKPTNIKTLCPATPKKRVFFYTADADSVQKQKIPNFGYPTCGLHAQFTACLMMLFKWLIVFPSLYSKWLAPMFLFYDFVSNY